MTAEQKVEKQCLFREQTFHLDAFDGKKIACWMNRAGDTPAKKAVILSHGLTGSPFEYIHMMARNYFIQQGYDVYRFAYYWDETDTRKLHECTLEIHGKDLNTVIAHVQKSHEKTFICGHSYGGLTMIFANPDVTAVSFWDSSYNSNESSWYREAEYIEELDCYGLPWGSYKLIGKAMRSEAELLLTLEKLDSMTGLLKMPAQIIAATDNGRNIKRLKDLYAALQTEKDFYIVEDADHCFVKGNVVHELLDKTYDWFERF